MVTELLPGHSKATRKASHHTPRNSKRSNNAFGERDPERSEKQNNNPGIQVLQHQGRRRLRHIRYIVLCVNWWLARMQGDENVDWCFVFGAVHYSNLY